MIEKFYALNNPMSGSLLVLMLDEEFEHMPDLKGQKLYFDGEIIKVNDYYTEDRKAFCSVLRGADNTSSRIIKRGQEVELYNEFSGKYKKIEVVVDKGNYLVTAIPHVGSFQYFEFQVLGSVADLIMKLK